MFGITLSWRTIYTRIQLKKSAAFPHQRTPFQPMVSPYQRDVAVDRLHAALTEEITKHVLPRFRTSTKMAASAVRVKPSASSGSLRTIFSAVQSYSLFACCVQCS